MCPRLLPVSLGCFRGASTRGLSCFLHPRPAALPLLSVPHLPPGTHGPGALPEPVSYILIECLCSRTYSLIASGVLGLFTHAHCKFIRVRPASFPGSAPCAGAGPWQPGQVMVIGARGLPGARLMPPPHSLEVRLGPCWARCDLCAAESSSARC